ncbi:LOW QUALITY PROTEIN: ribonuclease 3-like [Formica exsecta]|uniref:LOW QUALITY PROTEIN: ribonuclease 3-like n=1 Tax=Formica exsecta TaxID=72781 RepID=UPI0011447C0B|nr:LOW QUALITY PROTEIN: ribonuclease 3-like [Formica exsecta]
MANPSMNTGQTYYWSQEHMKYYPVPPVPNFPPPNYNQPPNYNFSYNVPPPNVSNVKSTNSMYQLVPPTYHDGATNFQNNVPYQNQTDPQYNNQYYDKTESAQQYASENYANWDRNSRDMYNNSADNEWHSNNSTSNWTTNTSYQNTSSSCYDTSKTYNDNERLCSTQKYESSQRIKEPEWKYNNRETLPNRSNSRQRSRSPEGRSEKIYRSRYDDHRDRYRQHSKGMSNLRESTNDSVYFERRSSYKRHESYTSRSEGSYTRNRTRKRSKSRESRSSRDKTPINAKRTKGPTERELLLEKYRRNYCATSKDIERKLNELSAMGSEGILESEKKIWTRTAPADLYYFRDENNPKIMRSTVKLQELCMTFKRLLIDRATEARALQPPYEPPPRKTRARLCRHKSEACSSSSSDSDSSMDEDDRTMEELMAKKQHPQRLHPEMWFNDPGEMNDGPLCRCSAKSRRSGIRHGIYAGEGAINKCQLNTNNADKLYHYRITISPPTNFLTKTPTIIKHDEHEFIFEGFSMLSHFPLVKLPTCKVIRFNIEYTILYIEEKLPENFTIQELDYFQIYLFREILELVDFDLHAAQDKSGCGQFHFMPRFVRDLADNGQEILSMNEVLNYLIKSSTLLIDPDDLPRLVAMQQYKWQDFADEVKGMVVTYPGKKPCSVRVDQLDRNQVDQPPGIIAYPEIVHFGIRPPQLSYAGNADYQKAWRDYVKFRHLLANMSKPSFEDKRKLEAKENKLQELRTQSKMKRDVTVDVTSDGFYRTGIMCDIVQHAMLIPVLVCHLRFHKSLDNLERTLGYEFKNRYLLQLALTHPSYRENFGTNPDHARNSLTNCGIGETLFKGEEDLAKVWVNYPRHPLQEQEPTGDRQWIPSFELLQKLTKFEESIGIEFTHIRLLARAFTDRSIGYTNLTLGSNQRLEFLGDTVLQLIVSEYLYKFFPEHHEGHLSLLRSSLVNNKTQAVVCDDLGMTQYALYGNPKAELKTKDRADLLEAFLGALYVDKGLKYCHVFCDVCFFPRLQDFIMNQDWNDPKSKLQQCCLTLRTMDGGEPDIPVYKVIECKGPTNTRVYTVAVYFQGKRLAKASGHSIQEAEMNSAKEALEKSQDLFPQLDHQKRVIAKSMKMQQWPNKQKPRGKSLRSSERSDDSDSGQNRRRSHSRESNVSKKRET